jgi:hypothetical protein
MVVYWPCTWPELPILSCFAMQHCHQISNSLVITLDRPLNLVLPDQCSFFQHEFDSVLQLIILSLIFSSFQISVIIRARARAHVCVCVCVCATRTKTR